MMIFCFELLVCGTHTELKSLFLVGLITPQYRIISQYITGIFIGIGYIL